MRRGDWIQTYSGIAFWPLDPWPQEVLLEDIAHALSNKCRFSGHTIRMYSVAEHCCHLYDYLVEEPRAARAYALFHDAAEAYLPDVPRPLKALMPEFIEAEDALLEVILQKFGAGASPAIEARVKELDTRILFDERNQLLGPSPRSWNFEAKPLDIVVECWIPRVAKEQFLRRAAEMGIRP